MIIPPPSLLSQGLGAAALISAVLLGSAPAFADLNKFEQAAGGECALLPAPAVFAPGLVRCVVTLMMGYFAEPTFSLCYAWSDVCHVKAREWNVD